jgi:hypothetical protein
VEGKCITCGDNYISKNGFCESCPIFQTRIEVKNKKSSDVNEVQKFKCGYENCDEQEKILEDGTCEACPEY